MITSTSSERTHPPERVVWKSKNPVLESTQLEIWESCLCPCPLELVTRWSLYQTQDSPRTIGDRDGPPTRSPKEVSEPSLFSKDRSFRVLPIPVGGSSETSGPRRTGPTHDWTDGDERKTRGSPLYGVPRTRWIRVWDVWVVEDR